VLIASPAYATDWEKFYTAVPGGSLEPIASPSPPVVEAIGSSDIRRIEADAYINGFAVIGYSSFNSSNANTKDAVRLATKLKAARVLIGTNLTSSETASIPITTPTYNTSTTSGSVNASGTGGTAYGTYNGTTTTTGSVTNYIPIQVNRFDKIAVFLKELPRRGIGIFCREMTDEERSRVGTNRAMMVIVTRRGSPAFNADLMANDLITQVDGQPFGPDEFKLLLGRAAKGEVAQAKFSILRAGEKREITVSIPSEW
jgi:hypothetical protein